ncbi:glucose inhibited division protein A-domain-containing protein, partial [Pisolithus tinctorius]
MYPGLGGSHMMHAEPAKSEDILDVPTWFPVIPLNTSTAQLALRELLRAPPVCSRHVHATSSQSTGVRTSFYSSTQNKYDVCVIGGGHAGCEAATGAARAGARTLLLTQKIATIGELSCNPSVGGVGKGTLVREVDALDGVIGRVADKAGIHFRMLNSSKGFRRMVDRELYREHMQDIILNYPNLDVRSASIPGEIIHCSQVVICTGTFLSGEIHIGMKRFPAGRMHEAPAIGLLGRLQTGTPARLDKNSIDFSRLERQEGDQIPASIFGEQVVCFKTHTTPETHKLVSDSIPLSIHIQETKKGPRYCPSLEAKVTRFGHKGKPHWYTSDLIYPNGLSCSMPEELQEPMMRTVPGLENARMVRPAYGVEYDYVDPRELKASLETKRIKGLFLAAAAQGCIAGINAGLAARGHLPLIITRADGYIGVMIDDLITRGAEEPCTWKGCLMATGMFTSRSECDNADLRLTEKGYEAGVVSCERWEAFLRDRNAIQNGIQVLQSVVLSPTVWEKFGFNVTKDGIFEELLRKPSITLDALAQSDAVPEMDQLEPHIKARIVIDATYAPHIPRQLADLQAFHTDESLLLDPNMDYSQ